MKFKTTRKAIVNETPSNNLFQCGYCDLANLLHYHSPVAYTCGVYGWNFDVYSVNGLTITTGYRNCCGNRIPYQITQHFDKKAKSIVSNWNLSYEDKKTAIDALLFEFCSILKGE